MGKQKGCLCIRNNGHSSIMLRNPYQHLNMLKQTQPMNLKLFILAMFIFGSCTSGNKETKNSPIAQETAIPDDITDLAKHGIANNPNNVLGGLKQGDLAPNFELEDQGGNLISLYEELEERPVLLVFYRADWCSICRRHLAEFQDRLNELGDSGQATVLAISPQLQQYSLTLHEDNGYSFPILYDQDHQAMKDYRVFFHVTEKYNQYITEEKGDPIELRNGNTEPVMPVAATYMIGQDKRIKYVHYDPNYRVRADVDEVLQSLNG